MNLTKLDTGRDQPPGLLLFSKGRYFQTNCTPAHFCRRGNAFTTTTLVKNPVPNSILSLLLYLEEPNVAQFEIMVKISPSLGKFLFGAYFSIFLLP